MPFAVELARLDKYVKEILTPHIEDTLLNLGELYLKDRTFKMLAELLSTGRVSVWFDVKIHPSGCQIEVSGYSASMIPETGDFSTFDHSIVVKGILSRDFQRKVFDKLVKRFFTGMTVVGKKGGEPNIYTVLDKPQNLNPADRVVQLSTSDV